MQKKLKKGIPAASGTRKGRQLYTPPLTNKTITSSIELQYAFSKLRELFPRKKNTNETRPATHHRIHGRKIKTLNHKTETLTGRVGAAGNIVRWVAQEQYRYKQLKRTAAKRNVWRAGIAPSRSNRLTRYAP